jgi:hypothetical protein
MKENCGSIFLYMQAAIVTLFMLRITSWMLASPSKKSVSPPANGVKHQNGNGNGNGAVKKRGKKL